MAKVVARGRSKTLDDTPESWQPPRWWVREAAALIVAGISLYLGLGLWSTEGTGTVGRLVATPFRMTFGATAYVLPVAGLVTAVRLFLGRASWSGGRWAACLGLMVSGAVLSELLEVGPARTLGGVFGEFVGQAVLRENFGRLGSYCVVVPVFLLCVLATTSTSIRETVGRLADLGGRLGERVRWTWSRRRAEVAADAPRPVLVRPENIRRERTEREKARRMEVVLPERQAAAQERKRRKREVQEAFSFAGTFRLPPSSFLDEPRHEGTGIDPKALEAHGEILQAKLEDFGIQGEVGKIHPGPVITTYEFAPAPGVKVSRIVNLADDLAMALRALSIRILAPMPMKSVVGIEVSNPRRETVYLREILESEDFSRSDVRLPLVLGKDSVGTPVVADLTRMPHLLVAGATGTGKSVSLNAIIMSILYRNSPDDVRFLMIDPKMLELSLYENIPHLLTRVVTDPKEASAVLSQAVAEMERRYRLLKDKGVRNIDSYNRALEREEEDAAEGVIVLKDAESDDKEWTLGERTRPEPLEHRKLPYLVVVIDELADLMLTSGRQVEEQITRLAQKARAAGIHLIVATQRPSVDVITGLIKANFPARVSFQVTSRIDSRTILDAIGAERLLGDGDMLFMPPGTARLARIHGAFVTEREIRKVAGFLKDQARPVFDERFTRALDEAHDEARPDVDTEDEADEMYEKALEVIAESRSASTSWLQRRLRIGYNRAARLIERMERDGIVGPADGARPREVLGFQRSDEE